MAQNRSSAVMQQRVEAHDSLDFFPTPPWATRALCEHVMPVLGHPPPLGKVWEPACGEGHMARPLAEYAEEVIASDVHDYGHGHVADFLMWGRPDWSAGVAWVVTNPPFRLAEQFIAKGLEVADQGVAVLLRVAFLEGVGRYEAMFRDRPPTRVAYFAERVPMVKGRLDKSASTATAYCWLVWKHGEQPRPPLWIPPCRKALERLGDYAGEVA